MNGGQKRPTRHVSVFVYDVQKREEDRTYKFSNGLLTNADLMLPNSAKTRTSESIVMFLGRPVTNTFELRFFSSQRNARSHTQEC